MSKAIVSLETAFKRAMEIRPKVGGFPYLAETLRLAGVTRNLWFLPACQSLYLTEFGPVVTVGTPLTSGTGTCRHSTARRLLQRCALIRLAKHVSGIPGCIVAGRGCSLRCRLATRTVVYYGCNSEGYVESCPAVEVKFSTPA